MKTRTGWLLLALGLTILLAGWWWLQSEGFSGSQSEADSVLNETPQAAPAAEPVPAGPRETVIQAVTESGVTVRIVKPVLIQRPQPPYGARYQNLIGPAEGGDAAAQYELALLLYECREVPEDAAAMEAQAERFYRTRKRGAWEVSDPASEAAGLRRDFADCSGVPGAARGSYRDWMRKAADSGLLQAQLDLMYHLPQREYCQYLYQCTAEQRKAQAALQAESLHYVTLARDAGSAAALWTFAAWYQGDEVLPANDVEAYAHYLALDQIQKAAGIQRRVQPMLTAMDRKLRPIDRTQAQERARELLSNPRCCVLTP